MCLVPATGIRCSVFIFLGPKHFASWACIKSSAKRNHTSRCYRDSTDSSSLRLSETRGHMNGSHVKTSGRQQKLIWIRTQVRNKSVLIHAQMSQVKYTRSSSTLSPDSTSSAFVNHWGILVPHSSLQFQRMTFSKKFLPFRFCHDCKCKGKAHKII